MATLGCFFSYFLGDFVLREMTIRHLPPDFSLKASSSNTHKPWIFLIDGFVGHPEYRWLYAKSPLRNYNHTFVNPNGRRYSKRRTAKAIVREMQRMLESDKLRRTLPLDKDGNLLVIVLGGSMGAQVAQQVAVELEKLLGNEGPKPILVKLILAAPLFNGAGIKDPNAKWLRRIPWRPGPISDVIARQFQVPGRAIVPQEPKESEKHRQWGRNISLIRFWDEGYEAAEPEDPPKLQNTPTFETYIFSCYQGDETNHIPTDDEVLWPSQITLWQGEDYYPNAKIRLLERGEGKHLNADIDPKPWERLLAWALAA